jgi:excinuclease ABC subunit C
MDLHQKSFSRIFCYQKNDKDGSEYFGPYTSFKTVNVDIFDLIKELIPKNM